MASELRPQQTSATHTTPISGAYPQTVLGPQICHRANFYRLFSLPALRRRSIVRQPPLFPRQMACCAPLFSQSGRDGVVWWNLLCNGVPGSTELRYRSHAALRCYCRVHAKIIIFHDAASAAAGLPQRALGPKRCALPTPVACPLIGTSGTVAPVVGICGGVACKSLGRCSNNHILRG